MRVTFISNFLNHHQLPFCKTMCKLTDNNFTFIATEEISKERINMGYVDMNNVYDFVLCAYDSIESDEKALKIAFDSDVVIIGSAPDKYILSRLKNKKLTFYYSERIYKKGLWRALSPRGYKFMHEKHTNYKNYPLYLLCSSAYTAADFAIQGAYNNKTFKWGYFPEIKIHDIDEIIKHKSSKNGVISILWAGRLIKWKHPECAILLAKELKGRGYNFNISIIGNGILEYDLKKMISDKGLSDCVSMLGSMSPEEVRKNMEKADIFIFTSDYNEGWGAVLNEAMNSACAVVASHAIGSVPFLINDGINGLVYKNASQKDLNESVISLFKNTDKIEDLGKNAYNTMVTKWNAEIAAKRFIELCNTINNESNKYYKDGPCSKAKIIYQWNMYKHCKKINSGGND